MYKQMVSGLQTTLFTFNDKKQIKTHLINERKELYKQLMQEKSRLFAVYRSKVWLIDKKLKDL